jgi:hypothetical protein
LLAGPARDLGVRFGRAGRQEGQGLWEGVQMKAEPRSGFEICQSLTREGWREEIVTRVFTSRDKTLVKVVWPDGKTAEAAAPKAERSAQ